MTANKIIVVSAILYTILLIITYIAFLNQKFTGSDAAGNGMAKGLTFFYGLGILFIIAVVLTIVNAFFFKDITSFWIKLVFFVPILLPLLIFVFIYLGIGRGEASIEKQVHSLIFEIRTKEKLNDVSFSLRTSGGSSSSKLDIEKKESGYYIYESSNAIFYETERFFYVESNEYGTNKYTLDIPYKPKIIPFTNWETLYGINEDTQDTIKLEFRYKISK